MKFFSTSIMLLLISLSTYSQSDRNGINYQAVARDAQGAVLANQALKVRATVLQDGVETYTEVFDPVNTNEFGLFTLVLGKGAPQTGTFGGIDWSVNKPHSLKINIDAGDGFALVGEMDFVSVPYAFIADSAVKGQRLKYNTNEDSLLLSGGSGVLLQGAPDGDWTTGSNLIYNLNEQVSIGSSSPTFPVANNRLYVEGGTNSVFGYTGIHVNTTADAPTNLGAGVTGVLVQITDVTQNKNKISGYTAEITQDAGDTSLVSGFSATVGGSGAGNKYGSSVLADGENGNTINVGSRGEASGNVIQNTGVLGIVSNQHAGSNYGVMGFSTATGGNLNVGVYGEASGATINYGGMFKGNVVPKADDQFKLGESNLRWSEVWATNGVIQTSDRRDKKEIEQLQYGLEDVLRLKPVSYKWIQSTDSTLKLGLIAQEVEKVIPEVVVKNTVTPPLSDGRTDKYGMAYVELVPVLIKAIQEQQEIIESLEKRIEALEKNK